MSTERVEDDDDDDDGYTQDPYSTSLKEVYFGYLIAFIRLEKSISLPEADFDGSLGTL